VYLIIVLKQFTNIYFYFFKSNIKSKILSKYYENDTSNSRINYLLKFLQYVNLLQGYAKIVKAILNECILSTWRAFKRENKYRTDILKISISFTFYLISAIDIHTSFTKYERSSSNITLCVDTFLFGSMRASRLM
jgi:hypothetical protein